MTRTCPHPRLLQSCKTLSQARKAEFLHQQSCRSFSQTRPTASHIGRAPLSIPPGVELSVIAPSMANAGASAARSKSQPSVLIKGPLGEMRMQIPEFLKIDQDLVARRAMVTVEDSNVKFQKAMWGTSRAYLANHILGVSEGHTCLLRMVGVGYRATIESKATTVKAEYEGQKFVSLKVGYSHPIELPIPKGVTASTPQPTRILLEGVEKEVIKQFAAEIRAWRVPEPYKGKGIFVDDETIKLKAKKIK